MKYLLIVMLSAASLQGYFEGATLEFRPNYFYPTSCHFRKLFSGGIDYQVTGTVPLKECVNLWLGVDYFSKHSCSNLLNNRIFIRIVPVTVGLKFFSPTVCTIQGYLGGGLKGYFVQTQNNACSVAKSVNRNGCGGVIEVGALKTFCNRFITDVFFSYSFKTLGAPTLCNCSVKAVELTVSGINVGAGVGYQF